MQIYTGIAPFTMARTAAGGYVNILAGDPVPTGVDEVDRDRLVAEGFLGYIEVPDPDVIDPAYARSDLFDVERGGDIPATLAWVGEDPDRVGQALAVEKAKGEKGRSTLVDQLQKLLGPVV